MSAPDLPTRFGFVGLGNMGRPIAVNLAAAGFDLVVHDAAGTAARAPADTTVAESLAQVAATAETIFLSLPDGVASVEVAEALAGLDARATTTVIDLSTIGIPAAEQAAEILAARSIAYADAPVSGGAAGARAGTITVMWGGDARLLERHRAAIEAFSGNAFHVGDKPGQGQAMKLSNKFLTATAMVATSEAVTFGLAHGLDLDLMLSVLNVSSGQNTATSDKFPNRIATGTYDAGFHTALLAKDVRLYLEGVQATGTPAEVGAMVADIWRRAALAMPGSDYTRIYDFVRNPGNS